MVSIGLKFYPNQKNPARQCGRGVYRVVSCIPQVQGSPKIKVLRGGEFLNTDLPTLLFLRSPRTFKIGSRVDPLKIALSANV